MVIPSKLTPPGDPDKPEAAGSGSPGAPTKESTAAKTTAPGTDDGSRKPFKEVLETTMAGKELKKPSKVTFTTDDDDDVKVTLLDLAAQSKIRETKTKPSITETAVFRQDAAVAPKSGLTGDLEVDTDIDVSEEITDSDVPPISKGLLESVSKDIVKATAKDTSDIVVAKDAKDDTAPLVPKVADKKASENVHVGDKRDEHVAAKKTDEEVKVSDKTEAKVTFHQALGHKVDPNNVVGLSAPHVVHAINAAAPAEAAAKVSNARELLLKLAQSMVDRIQEVKTPGRTETTLTLTYPPLFEGVKIKLTEFDTSQKQFNLTFSDVNNPMARAMIEQQDNQVRLQQALLERGYTMQMVTIEQKIPGLNSTETGEATLKQPGYQEGGQAGSATDQDEGNVT